MRDSTHQTDSAHDAVSAAVSAFKSLRNPHRNDEILQANVLELVHDFTRQLHIDINISDNISTIRAFCGAAEAIKCELKLVIWSHKLDLEKTAAHAILLDVGHTCRGFSSISASFPLTELDHVENLSGLLSASLTCRTTALHIRTPIRFDDREDVVEDSGRGRRGRSSHRQQL